MLSGFWFLPLLALACASSGCTAFCPGALAGGSASAARGIIPPAGFQHNWHGGSRLKPAARPPAVLCCAAAGGEDGARAEERQDHDRLLGSRLLGMQLRPRREIASSLAGMAAGILVSGGACPLAAEAEGLDKSSLQSDYNGYAKTYDELDGGVAAKALGIEETRDELLQRAEGKVLEVGVGTGMNLGRYRFASQGGGGLVESVVGIDLSKGMLDEAGAKAARLQLPLGKDLILRLMDVEKLDFQDASFDTVVDTYGLCVFSDPVKALREMGRVCRPGGRILMLENAVSRDAVLGAYMKATAPLVARLGGKGCFYDQDPAVLARQAGLTVLEETDVLVGGVLRRLVLTPSAGK